MENKQQVINKINNILNNNVRANTRILKIKKLSSILNWSEKSEVGIDLIPDYFMLNIILFDNRTGGTVESIKVNY